MMRSISLSLLLLLLSPASALAETTDQLIERGIGLREKGKDVEALALFDEAYQKSKSAKALAQVALAEQALGRWIEAESHLAEALASKDKWIGARKKPLSAALESIRDRLGDLEIFGSPEGAQVILNGKAIGELPLRSAVRVVAGTIVVDLTKDGFRSGSRTVQVKARSLARETIDLVPALAEAAPPPPPPKSAPPPPVVVETKADSGGPELTGYGIAAASVAGAGVIVGVAGLVLRASFINKYNDDDMCLVGGMTRDENCGDKLDSAKRFEAMAIGGFVAGGVFAATAVLLFIFDGGDGATVRF